MTDIPTDVALETPKSWCSLERFSRWVLALALLVVVASFVAFLLLALPAHDDYIRATQPHMYQRSVQGLVHHEYGFGYWAYCRKLYMEWQGRWGAFCLEAAILSRGDMTKIYPALLGAVAVVNVAGLWRCLSSHDQPGIAMVQPCMRGRPRGGFVGRNAFNGTGGLLVYRRGGKRDADGTRGDTIGWIDHDAGECAVDDICIGAGDRHLRVA